MNNTNNFTGSISMNPKRLYEISLKGIELEEKVKTNYEKLNVVVEELIQSVKTPELNKQLESLYEIFKRIEENFNNNNNVINDFFTKKINEYNTHAENITSASNTLMQNAGFESNTNIGSVTPINLVGSNNNNYNHTKPIIHNNDTNMNISDNTSHVQPRGNNDNIISLDKREWEGFEPKVEK